MVRVISLAFAAVLISACAQLATVKNVEPLPPAAGTTSAGSFSTEREARRDPEAAVSQDLVRTMNTLPIADHIPYHSIIGDRGRGDTPNSSDGVVPYWS